MIEGDGGGEGRKKWGPGGRGEKKKFLGTRRKSKGDCKIS